MAAACDNMVNNLLRAATGCFGSAGRARRSTPNPTPCLTSPRQTGMRPPLRAACQRAAALFVFDNCRTRAMAKPTTVKIKAELPQVRPGRAQACRVQGSEDQV